MTHFPTVQWKRLSKANIHFLSGKNNKIEIQGFSGEYQNRQVIQIKWLRSRQLRRNSHCNEQQMFSGKAEAHVQEFKKKGRTKLTNFGTTKRRTK